MPKIVTTGVSAATSSRRLGSVLGRVVPVAGRPEGGELRRLPALLAGRGEELDVLGVGAGPAALDEREAVLVEHPRDAQLVGEREGDVLALGAVAEGGVVERYRLVGHVGCPCVEGRVVDSHWPATRREAGTGRQIAIRSPITRAISLVPTRLHAAASSAALLVHDEHPRRSRAGVRACSAALVGSRPCPPRWVCSATSPGPRTRTRCSGQLVNAVERQGPGDLAKLIGTGATWEVN